MWNELVKKKIISKYSLSKSIYNLQFKNIFICSFLMTFVISNRRSIAQWVTEKYNYFRRQKHNKHNLKYKTWSFWRLWLPHWLICLFRASVGVPSCRAPFPPRVRLLGIGLAFLRIGLAFLPRRVVRVWDFAASYSFLLDFLDILSIVWFLASLVCITNYCNGIIYDYWQLNYDCRQQPAPYTLLAIRACFINKYKIS